MVIKLIIKVKTTKQTKKMEFKIKLTKDRICLSSNQNNKMIKNKIIKIIALNNNSNKIVKIMDKHNIFKIS